MFNRLDFAIPPAPSGVSVRKRSKYKCESGERLREFQDKCSVRDTDASSPWAKSTQISK